MGQPIRSTAAKLIDQGLNADWMREIVTESQPLRTSGMGRQDARALLDISVLKIDPKSNRSRFAFYQPGKNHKKFLEIMEREIMREITEAIK